MDQSLTMPLTFKAQWHQLLRQPRLFCILFLGFASGFPLLLTGSTLQAWYAVSHVNVMTIGVLTLIGQPYVYKFCWAPFFDRYSPPWLGRRRGWIFLTQLLLIFGIGLMGILQPSKSPITLATLALMVAFLSASQDIAIDAHRTELLLPTERGLGAGLNTMGYRIAMLVTGALALIMADYIGWKLTYWFMAFLMSLQLLTTYFSSDPIEIDRPTDLRQAMLDPFKQFFTQKQAFSLLIFIILYKLGDVFTLTLGTTFLIQGLGFSLTDIGLMYKFVGMLGIFAGSIAGGIWMLRLTLLRALVIFGLIQALVSLPFLLLAIYGKHYLLLVVAVFLENFGSGLGSIAFLGFIMCLCDHRYTATQFALFTALAALGRVYVGPLAGFIVTYYGWIQLYAWAFILGFPGVLMLLKLRRHPLFIEN